MGSEEILPDLGLPFMQVVQSLHVVANFSAQCIPPFLLSFLLLSSKSLCSQARGQGQENWLTSLQVCQSFQISFVGSLTNTLKRTAPQADPTAHSQLFNAISQHCEL